MAKGPLVHVCKAVTSTLKVAWSNLLDEEPKFQMENSSICMNYVSMSWDAVVSCLLENLLCGILSAYMMYIIYTIDIHSGWLSRFGFVMLLLSVSCWFVGDFPRGRLGGD